MDNLSHAAAGVFIAWALPPRWTVPRAVPVAVAAALVPDLDLLLEPYLPAGSIFLHRGFTHSLFGVALLAPLLALLPTWISRNKRNYAGYAIVAACAMLSHVLLDLPTELGARVFWPFSQQTVYLDWLGHLDFTYFLLSLFVLLAAWSCRNEQSAKRRAALSMALLAIISWVLYSAWPLFAVERNRRFAPLENITAESFRTVYPLVLGGTLMLVLALLAWKNWGLRHDRAWFGRAGLAAFAAYLLLCGAAQRLAIRELDRFAQERGIAVLRRGAMRLEAFSFVAPLRWTGLLLAPEGVYEAEITPFFPGESAFRLYPSAAEGAYLARSRSIPRVQRALSEARYPVSCYREDGGRRIVEFYDHGQGWGVARVTFADGTESPAVHWINIDEYPSNAPGEVVVAEARAPGAAADGATAAASPPCFLREGAARLVYPH